MFKSNSLKSQRFLAFAIAMAAGRNLSPEFSDEVVKDFVESWAKKGASFEDVAEQDLQEEFDNSEQRTSTQWFYNFALAVGKEKGQPEGFSKDVATNFVLVWADTGTAFEDVTEEELLKKYDRCERRTRYAKSKYWKRELPLFDGILRAEAMFGSDFTRDTTILAAKQAFQELEDQNREILHLCYVVGHSRAEVAEMMNMSPDQLERAVTRARTAFKGAMGDDDDG